MPIVGLQKSGQEEEIETKYLTGASLQNFCNIVSAEKTRPVSDEPLIKVSSAVSGAAHFYERLRYSVDYHEEQVLRRHALKRILKRRYEGLSEIRDSARSLLVELIHARYLKNEYIPERMAEPVQILLDKYESLFLAIKKSPCRNKPDLIDWFLGVAASELDELLVPAQAEKLLINLIVNKSLTDNSLTEWKLSPSETRQQTIIAAYRAMYALDLAKLNFVLLVEREPDWLKFTSMHMKTSLPAILKHHMAIENSLRSDINERLYRVIKKRSLVFHALSAGLSEYGQELLQSEQTLVDKLTIICTGYYQAQKKRLFRAALRATFYILLTKMVVAVAVEAPLENRVYGDDISLVPLMINIFFPPIFIFLLTLTARLPGSRNTDQVVKYALQIAQNKDERLFQELPILRRSSAVSTSFLSIVYLLMYVVTFGLIFSLLHQVGFTLISTAFFMFFLCLVSFFAMRIRQPVSDLYVVSRRENVLVVIMQFISVPILKVGRFISLTSSRFNVVLYLFDYFLEAPVKSFLLVAEDVLGFFRQKREDIF